MTDRVDESETKVRSNREIEDGLSLRGVQLEVTEAKKLGNETQG